MFWLICAILSSSAIAVAMKASEKHIDNNVGLIVVNYICCSITAFVYMGNPAGLINEPNFGLSMILAVIGGVLYITGFLLLQWNISKNGVVLSSVFVKMGLLVTFLISVLYFHEKPGPVQLAGFVLAVIAILIINLEKGSTRAASTIGLIALLISGGCSDGISKFFEYYGSEKLNGVILFVQFITCLILGLVYLKYRKQRIGKPEILFGLLVGIPNYFCSLFLLKALVTVPAVILFPTYSVGAFLVVSAVGMVVFGEKLSRKQLLGCVLIIASLLMLNL